MYATADTSLASSTFLSCATTTVRSSNLPRQQGTAAVLDKTNACLITQRALSHPLSPVSQSRGGAAFAGGQMLVSAGSRFELCAAALEGGALYSAGAAEVAGSTFVASTSQKVPACCLRVGEREGRIHRPLSPPAPL